MLSRSLRAIGTATLAAAIVIGGGSAAFAVEGGVTPDYNRQSVTILGTGSDSTFEAMQDLDVLYGRSAGCAVGMTTGFNSWSGNCLDPAVVPNAAFSYGGAPITNENWYHDRIAESFPVGSSAGAKTLNEFTKGTAGANNVDFARSSSGTQKTNCTNTTAGVTYTCYGVSYARDGIGVWIGKNNVAVQSAKNGGPRFYQPNLHDIFAGTAGGDCLVRYDRSPAAGADSVGSATVPLTTIAAWTATDEKSHKNAAGKMDTIVPYATQTSSGAGKDFVILGLGISAAADAAPMQACIPTVFKNNNPTDGEHVIFENNATPICQQPTGTATGGKSDQALAIYPYTLARFTQNGAGSGSCAGQLAKISTATDDGSTGGFVKPTVKSIGLLSGPKAYPISRYVYNYFQIPSNLGGGFDLNTPSTWTLANGVSAKLQAVLMYMSPYGFLCQTAHSDDPNTGLSYRLQLESILKKDGFAPIANGATGAGWTNTSHCRGSAT